MKIVDDGIIFDVGDFRLKKSELIKVKMVPCRCPCNMIILSSTRGLFGRPRGMVTQQMSGGVKQVLVPPMMLPFA
jgi:hypothetical protein